MLYDIMLYYIIVQYSIVHYIIQYHITLCHIRGLLLRVEVGDLAPRLEQGNCRMTLEAPPEPLL